MSVSGDKYIPGATPGKQPLSVSSKDIGKVAGGRKFDKRAKPSKSYKLATAYLKSMFADFGKIRGSSLTLSDAKKTKVFKKQLKDLKAKLELLDQSLTKEEKKDITPQKIEDLEKLIFFQLLDLEDKVNIEEVLKNIFETEQKLSEMTILHYRGKMNRLSDEIDIYYLSKLSLDERNAIFERYDDLIEGIGKEIRNLDNKSRKEELLLCDEAYDLEKKLDAFSSDFLSIKRKIAAKKLQPCQNELNDYRASLSKTAANLSTQGCRKEIANIINQLTFSLTIRDEQLEIDQLNKVIKDLKEEMSQNKKEVDIVIIRDVFATTYKGFVGVKKISRREYQDLSHSYFVIREVKRGRVEYTMQQQFHKKLHEHGFIGTGAVKDVHKLKSPKTGDIDMVRSVVKPGKTVFSQAIQAVDEFRDDPNLCGGHYLTYKSRKSDEKKRVFLHPYMDSDLLGLIKKKGTLDQKLQLDIMLKICRGVKKMHDGGWIHKDIKPDNILVQTNQKSKEIIIKLADFDSAEKPTDSNRIAQFGTPLYMAPELLKKQISGLEAGQNCDIYSLGMTFWDISENKRPFFNINSWQKLDPPLTSNELVLKREFPESAKQTPMQRLIFHMINPSEPNMRPRIDDVILELESMLQKL